MPWRRAWPPTLVFLPGESPWTEEPGRLQSMRSQRVGYDWATKHSTAAHLLKFKHLHYLIVKRQENPKPSIWSGTHRNRGQREKCNSHFWGFFPLQKTQTTSSGLHSGEFRGSEQVMFSGTFLYYDSMWVNELCNSIFQSGFHGTQIHLDDP